MSMSQSMERWCQASIVKWFSTYGASFQFFVEGQVRESQLTQTDIMELRVDGPMIREYQKQKYTLTFEINVLLQLVIQPGDLYHIQRRTGQARAGFTNEIPVYTYGDGDTPTLIGCLILQTRGRRHNGIVVTQHGQIDATKQLHYVTLEGHYDMDYQE